MNSLEEITTGYTIFEKDQVLTHNQLNEVAEYGNDQNRLTRVALLGVGIVCGLRVTLRDANVILSKGAGVTTDGDLLYFAEGKVFDKFKLYDNSNPVYAPFQAGESMIKAYELVAKNVQDERATPLSQFTTEQELKEMVAVLFVQSYVKDEDICSGTDCDNLGQEFVNMVKLLLVKPPVGLPTKNMPRPLTAAEIVAERPLWGPNVRTPADLAKVYRTVCNSIHGKLDGALANLHRDCPALMRASSLTHIGEAWSSRLKVIRQAFTRNDFGIQYYYDFLKDLVETYNHLRELLFGDRTWCCPDLEAFPKHLLLGKLDPAADPQDNRTPFYPSPIVSRTAEQVEHAQFLLNKLRTLITTFEIPAPVANLPPKTCIRVTPSSTEACRLEDRAIPYYYQVTSAHPVQKNWSYRLHEHRMDAWNYSYNASLYGAQGGAAHPLTSQIGRFSFFRIEGHLGHEVSAVAKFLEGQIKQFNLPLSVYSVLLAPDVEKIVPSGSHYSDLDRIHYLLRQDLAHQLVDVERFSGILKKQVDEGIRKKMITDSPEDNDGPKVKAFTAERHAQIVSNTLAAGKVLNGTYQNYLADPSWKTRLGDTMKAASEFRADLGKVITTQFATPFDSLIGNSHHLWLDWLEQMIRQRDQQANEKRRFGGFLSEHPELEHFGGAPRGGTFVLVYDIKHTVIADFMLDYRLSEQTAPRPEEPPLPKPDWKPVSVIDNGFKINPALDKIIRGKLDQYTHEVIDPKIKLQQKQVDWFKDLALTRSEAPLRSTYGDAVTDVLVNEAEKREQTITELTRKSRDPDLSPEARRELGQKIKEEENALATTTKTAAAYLAEAGVDVSPASQGRLAVGALLKSVTVISNPTTRHAITSKFDRLKIESAKPAGRSRPA